MTTYTLSIEESINLPKVGHVLVVDFEDMKATPNPGASFEGIDCTIIKVEPTFVCFGGKDYNRWNLLVEGKDVAQIKRGSTLRINISK